MTSVHLFGLARVVCRRLFEVISKFEEKMDYSSNFNLIRDACLHMGGILAAPPYLPAPQVCLPIASLLMDGISSNIYLVALGKFSEFGAMTFQPIREVT